MTQKGKIVLGVFIVVVVFIFCILLLRVKMKVTFENITNEPRGNVREVKVLTLDDEQIYELQDKDIDLFYDNYWKKFEGSTGTTQHNYVVFYDKDGLELFRIMEYGNQDLYEINNIVYKMICD